MGETRTVGRVSELWRYPVKSMQGEPVPSIELAPGGVVGDRAYGLVDVATGHLLSAKAVPELFQARAHTVGDSVAIALPDGREVSSADEGAAAVLSAWLGRDVALMPSGSVGADGQIDFELRFDPADDAGDLVAWPAREGTFLDSAPVHLLTTASLAVMAEARPETAWDLRRFRPNLLIDAGAAHGFVEDTWIGLDLELGAAGTTLHVDRACGRCAMPLRAQPALAWAGAERAALDGDIGVFRALTAEHGNDLGVYADVARVGVVTVGDEVRAEA